MASTTIVSGPRARREPGASRGVPPPTGNRALFERSVWFFAVFAFFVLAAFWPGYFSRPLSQLSYHPHAHGLAMSAWVALLVAQGWLMRTGRRPLHRRLGKAAYAIVPLIAVTTIDFVHFRLQGAPASDDGVKYFLALVLNALVAFVLLFGLAMWHRRNSGTHARYMICTVFPLFTPVTDRILGAMSPTLVAMAPRIGGQAVMPVYGFALADAMLVALAVWDWRVNRRRDVFPIALVIVGLFQLSVLTFHRVPAWEALAGWFVGLPR